MGLGPHDGGGEEKVPRPPQFSDLSRICGELTRLRARYVVVGGFAIIHHGFPRRMKQTPREKDEPDRLFLRELLTSQGISINLSRPTAPEDAVTRWLKRL